MIPSFPLSARADQAGAQTLSALEADLARQVAMWNAQGGSAEVLRTSAAGSIRLRTSRETCADFCSYLRETLPFALVTLVALDERERQGAYLVRATFGLEASPFFLSVEWLIPDGPEDQLTYQSLTPRFPVANWYEREHRDLFGLVPVGHPDPRRLVLHRHFPRDVHPLRRDMPLTFTPPFLPDDETFHNRVSGDGVLEIPVGPIHAGIIEPGHFRFSAVGEQIVNLEARLFYTHRGIEKQCEGLSISRALYLVERTCAACTISNTLAFCQALENLAEPTREFPARAAYLRVIYAELERLYNHIGDIGNICAGIGFHAGAQGGALLKEQLLHLNEQLLGSRYLFGVITPGGVRRNLRPQDCPVLQQELARIQRKFTALSRLITQNEWAMERFQHTGIVTQLTACDLGAVGVAARASGIDRDVRRDYPYAAYRALLPFPLPVRESGDVLARIQVREQEAHASFQLIESALAQLPAGPHTSALGELPVEESSFSLTESPRGATCHWVQIGPNQTIERYRVRTASYVNWPVVVRAALGNMVPDFPLINKSFELCYSCLDR